MWDSNNYVFFAHKHAREAAQNIHALVIPHAEKLQMVSQWPWLHPAILIQYLELFELNDTLYAEQSKSTH